MVVERMLGGGKGNYPYLYRVQLTRDDLVSYHEVANWATEVDLDVRVYPTAAVYIRNDIDLAAFLLKWKN